MLLPSSIDNMAVLIDHVNRSQFLNEKESGRDIRITFLLATASLNRGSKIYQQLTGFFKIFIKDDKRAL